MKPNEHLSLRKWNLQKLKRKEEKRTSSIDMPQSSEFKDNQIGKHYSEIFWGTQTTQIKEQNKERAKKAYMTKQLVSDSK